MGPQRHDRTCYRARMSPEALTIVATGIALAAVNVGMFPWL